MQALHVELIGRKSTPACSTKRARKRAAAAEVYGAVSPHPCRSVSGSTFACFTQYWSIEVHAKHWRTLGRGQVLPDSDRHLHLTPLPESLVIEGYQAGAKVTAGQVFKKIY